MLSNAKQFGGSAIGIVITLAVLAYGVFVGIQFVPQYIESTTVDTILDGLAETHSREPFDDVGAVHAALDSQLYINQMGAMKGNFSVIPSRDSFIVTARYERELNLLYEKKQIQREMSVTLD
jgi:hypothetical protein